MQATIREAVDWCGGAFAKEPSGADLDSRLTGASIDSRTIQPGQLFVPLAGERVNGHAYIHAAVQAGAAASLWEKDQVLPTDVDIPLLIVEDAVQALQAIAQGYLSRMDAKVIGVTGSNGKTTTKDLITSVLGVRYRVHKTEGNYNNHLGLPLTILNAKIDTEFLVLEMGMSERGEISLLSKLACPDVAIITNIGESHLLQLGSRRNIAAAKLEMLDGLKKGGTLVYNGNEPLLQEKLVGLSDIRTIAYGEARNQQSNLHLDLTAEHVDVSVLGTTFEVNAYTGVRFELPIPGRHNAINALAAIAIGAMYGLTAAELQAGLMEARLTGMRIERTKARNGATVLNDAYNASPTSIKAAIDLVSALSGFRQKWLVLGDVLELGPDEAAYHAEIGAYLDSTGADWALFFGPLSEHACRAATRMAPGHAIHYSTKEALIDTLLREVQPDDLVLIKASRGMRMEQVADALVKGEKE